MIKVIIYENNIKEFKGFDVKGHAGYDKYGKDIICAAVSTLVVTTINSIEEFTDDGISYEETQDGGYVSFRFTETPCSESVLLIRSFILGIQGVSEDYGKKYLKLTFKEV